MAVVGITDLAMPSIEGLWLEISLPNSRGFFIGLFFWSSASSNCHNRAFMPKFDEMLDLAVEQGREVIISGDMNCVLFSGKGHCKQLKSVLRAQYFNREF